MGRVLGGCMTLLEATIGTPWELDTKDSILVLEDRGMKPYQVDRVLMHLKQAGKFEGVRGLCWEIFRKASRPCRRSNVREVCGRILRPLGVPIVFGAPIGHTVRPMFTIPLAYKHAWMPMGKARSNSWNRRWWRDGTRHVHVLGLADRQWRPWPGCCATTVFA